MKTYFCNGAETAAENIREAVLAFARLEAFNAYGEEGFVPGRFVVEVQPNVYRATVGRFLPSGVTCGELIVLKVEEVDNGES